MELPKRRILMNANFKAQFNYCPAVWMFDNHSLNNKINRLHERCLIIIYHDKHSNFEEMLAKDNSVSMHHNNIHNMPSKCFECLTLRYNARRYSQSLPVLISRDPCCFSRKICFGSIFLLILVIKNWSRLIKMVKHHFTC